MLRAMREHYAANRLDQAAAIARDAAPYFHARLAAVAHSGSIGSYDDIPDAELESELAREAREVLGALGGEETPRSPPRTNGFGRTH